MHTTRELIAIVGAGFSGAVIAHELAKSGFKSEVFDIRPHVAGNCHTARDPATGVLLHVYGPHIFHTSNRHVWDYVRTFDEFCPFVNRVKAVTKGRVYTLPINLLTINQFFGTCLSPAEARTFIDELGDTSIKAPRTFEEQALRYLGHDLYEAFFKHYTIKQWGISPSALPSSILKRLPIRFTYDDNYYESQFQGIPRNGYTYIVERMLDHHNIHVTLGSRFERRLARNYSHVFVTAPIDSWFEHCEGELGYRTLDFKVERHHGDFQGNAVINYCDADVPWTRISEHKHFAPWESHEQTLIYREASRACGKNDIPYYPIRLVDDKSILTKYVELGNRELNTTFVGRLGTYRYLDMHVAIAEALDAAHRFLAARNTNTIMPNFLVDCK